MATIRVPAANGVMLSVEIDGDQPTATEQQRINDYVKRYESLGAPPAAPLPAEELGPWDAGWSNVGADLNTAAGGILQGLGLDEAANRFYDTAAQTREDVSKRYKPIEIDQISSIGDVGQFAYESFFGSLPYVIPTVVGAGITGGGTLLAGGTRALAGVAGRLGAFGGSAAPMIGQFAERQAQENNIPINQIDWTKPVVYGSVAAALDLVTPEVLGVFGKLSTKAKAGDEVAQKAIMSYWRSLPPKIAKAALVEAGTESAQQALEIWQANPEKFYEMGPDVRKELITAAAAGLLVGPVFEAVNLGRETAAGIADRRKLADDARQQAINEQFAAEGRANFESTVTREQYEEALRSEREFDAAEAPSVTSPLDLGYPYWRDDPGARYGVTVMTSPAGTPVGYSVIGPTGDTLSTHVTLDDARIQAQALNASSANSPSIMNEYPVVPLDSLTPEVRQALTQKRFELGQRNLDAATSFNEIKNMLGDAIAAGERSRLTGAEAAPVFPARTMGQSPKVDTTAQTSPELEWRQFLTPDVERLLRAVGVPGRPSVPASEPAPVVATPETVADPETAAPVPEPEVTGPAFDEETGLVYDMTDEEVARLLNEQPVSETDAGDMADYPGFKLDRDYARRRTTSRSRPEAAAGAVPEPPSPTGPRFSIAPVEATAIGENTPYDLIVGGKKVSTHDSLSAAQTKAKSILAKTPTAAVRVRPKGRSWAVNEYKGGEGKDVLVSTLKTFRSRAEAQAYADELATQAQERAAKRAQNKDIIKRYEALRSVRKAVVARMMARLKELGADGLRLNFVEVFSAEGEPDFTAEGSFDATERMMTFALGIYDPNLSEDQLFSKLDSVFDHEFVHVLQRAGVISKREWKAFIRYAKTKQAYEPDGSKAPGTWWDRASRLYARQDDDTDATYAYRLAKESMSEAYRSWRREKKSVTGQVGGIFRRIMQVIKTLGRFGRDEEVVQKLFSDIAEGKRNFEMSALSRTTGEAMRDVEGVAYSRRALSEAGYQKLLSDAFNGAVDYAGTEELPDIPFGPLPAKYLTEDGSPDFSRRLVIRPGPRNGSSTSFTQRLEVFDADDAASVLFKEAQDKYKAEEQRFVTDLSALASLNGDSASPDMILMNAGSNLLEWFAEALDGASGTGRFHPRFLPVKPRTPQEEAEGARATAAIWDQVDIAAMAIDLYARASLDRRLPFQGFVVPDDAVRDGSAANTAVFRDAWDRSFNYQPFRTLVDKFAAKAIKRLETIATNSLPSRRRGWRRSAEPFDIEDAARRALNYAEDEIRRLVYAAADTPPLQTLRSAPPFRAFYDAVKRAEDATSDQFGELYPRTAASPELEAFRVNLLAELEKLDLSGATKTAQSLAGEQSPYDFPGNRSTTAAALREIRNVVRTAKGAANSAEATLRNPQRLQEAQESYQADMDEWVERITPRISKLLPNYKAYINDPALTERVGKLNDAKSDYDNAAARRQSAPLGYLDVHGSGKNSRGPEGQSILYIGYASFPSGDLNPRETLALNEQIEPLIPDIYDGTQGYRVSGNKPRVKQRAINDAERRHRDLLSASNDALVARVASALGSDVGPFDEVLVDDGSYDTNITGRLRAILSDHAMTPTAREEKYAFRALRQKTRRVLDDIADIVYRIRDEHWSSGEAYGPDGQDYRIAKAEKVVEALRADNLVSESLAKLWKIWDERQAAFKMSTDQFVPFRRYVKRLGDERRARERAEQDERSAGEARLEDQMSGFPADLASEDSLSGPQQFYRPDFSRRDLVLRKTSGRTDGKTAGRGDTFRFDVYNEADSAETEQRLKDFDLKTINALDAIMAARAEVTQRYHVTEGITDQDFADEITVMNTTTGHFDPSDPGLSNVLRRIQKYAQDFESDRQQFLDKFFGRFWPRPEAVGPLKLFYAIQEGKAANYALLDLLPEVWAVEAIKRNVALEKEGKGQMGEDSLDGDFTTARVNAIRTLASQNLTDADILSVAYKEGFVDITRRRISDVLGSRRAVGVYPLVKHLKQTGGKDLDLPSVDPDTFSNSDYIPSEFRVEVPGTDDEVIVDPALISAVNSQKVADVLAQIRLADTKYERAFSDLDRADADVGAMADRFEADRIAPSAAQYGRSPTLLAFVRGNKPPVGYWSSSTAYNSIAPVGDIGLPMISIAHEIATNATRRNAMLDLKIKLDEAKRLAVQGERSIGYVDITLKASYALTQTPDGDKFNTPPDQAYINYASFPASDMTVRETFALMQKLKPFLPDSVTHVLGDRISGAKPRNIADLIDNASMMVNSASADVNQKWDRWANSIRGEEFEARLDAFDLLKAAGVAASDAYSPTRIAQALRYTKLGDVAQKAYSRTRLTEIDLRLGTTKYKMPPLSDFSKGIATVLASELGHSLGAIRRRLYYDEIPAAEQPRHMSAHDKVQAAEFSVAQHFADKAVADLAPELQELYDAYVVQAAAYSQTNTQRVDFRVPDRFKKPNGDVDFSRRDMRLEQRNRWQASSSPATPNDIDIVAYDIIDKASGEVIGVIDGRVNMTTEPEIFEIDFAENLLERPGNPVAVRKDIAFTVDEELNIMQLIADDFPTVRKVRGVRVSGAKYKNKMERVNRAFRALTNYIDGLLYDYAGRVSDPDFELALLNSATDPKYVRSKREQDAWDATIARSVTPEEFGRFKAMRDEYDAAYFMNVVQTVRIRPRTQKVTPEFSKRFTGKPEFKSWFRDGYVKEPDGSPRVLYHGTAAEDDFSIFSTKSERSFGAHLGTLRQAEGFAISRERGRIIPVYTNIKNPLRLTDMLDWFPIDVAYQAAAEMDMPPQEFRKVLDAMDAPPWDMRAEDRIKMKIGLVQKMIRDAGYDSVVYLNRHEGLNQSSLRKLARSEPLWKISDEQFKALAPEAADSYIILDPANIKSIFNEAPTTGPRIDYSNRAKASKALARRVKNTDGLSVVITNVYNDKMSVKKSALTAVPDIHSILPYLLPEEAERMNAKAAASIVEMFNNTPSVEEMAAVAISGQAKRGWYERSAAALIRIFGEVDAPRFSALLAALSPQTSVESNAINALTMWVNWVEAGRPRDPDKIVAILARSVQGKKLEKSVLDAWRNNTVTALSTADHRAIEISGNKVTAFMQNLNDVVNAVTNDAWMASYGDVDQDKFTGYAYHGYSAKARMAAEYATKVTGVTWTPREIQETIWSWAKALYETRDVKGETRTMKQILKAGGLTNAMVADVPDFATLFTYGTYRTILEAGGYGPQLEEMLVEVRAREGSREVDADFAAASVYSAQGTGFAESAFIRHLDRAAARLEVVFGRRKDEAEVKRIERARTRALQKFFNTNDLRDIEGVPGVYPETLPEWSRRGVPLGAVTAPLSPSDVEAVVNRLTYSKVRDGLARALRGGTIAGRKIGLSDATASRVANSFYDNFADKALVLGEMVDAVREANGNVADLFDPMLQEQLWSSAAKQYLDEVKVKLYDPLYAQLRQIKLSQADIEKFKKLFPRLGKVVDASEIQDVGIVSALLYARHASERNLVMNWMNNGKLPDGSGITSAEGAAAVKWFESRADWDKFKKAERLVRAIVNETNDVRVKFGLTKDFRTLQNGPAFQAVGLPNGYNHYVPLKGLAEEDGEVTPDISDFRLRSGAGFKLAKPEDMKAMGRKTLANNILEHVILQNEMAIIRGHKNVVGNAVYRLVESNPQTLDGIAKVMTKPPTRRIVGSDGKVKVIVDPLYANKDHYFATKINGEVKVLELFDSRLARLLNGVEGHGSEIGQFVMQKIGGFTSLMARLSTGLNPEFWMGNVPRDVMTNAINLNQYNIPDVSKKLAANWLPALKAAQRANKFNWNFVKTGDEANPQPQTRDDQLYQLFMQEGGFTGYLGLSNLETRLLDINKQIKKGTESGVMAGAQSVKRFAEFVEGYNNVLENTTRFAVFKTLIEAGLSPQRAAQGAKTVGTNFNAGGYLKPMLNPLYMFYSASINGSMGIAMAMARSKKVQKMVGAIVVAGIMQDLVMSMLSERDDDGQLKYDKVREYLHKTHMIFVDPTGLSEDGYIKIPMPWGFNAFFNSGRALAKYLRQKATGGNYTLGKATSEIFGGFIDAFNPIGGTNNIVNFVMPTILDPVVDIYATNEDFAGNKIAKTPLGLGVDMPSSQLYWNSTSPTWVSVSDLLNAYTGGTDVVPGKIDVSPDVLKYVFEYYTGGAGAFVRRMLDFGTVGIPAMAAGEFSDVEVGEIPFVRRVIGSTTDSGTSQQFFEIRDSVLRAGKELQEAGKVQDIDRLNSARSTYSKELKVYGIVKAANSQRNAIVKQIAAVRDNQKLTSVARSNIIRQLKEREREVMNRAVTEYNRIVLGLPIPQAQPELAN